MSEIQRHPSVTNPAAPRREEPRPATDAKRQLAEWAQRAIKHHIHHFNIAQHFINDYTDFIFRNKFFTPEEVVAALGAHARSVLDHLIHQAAMVEKLTGMKIEVIPAQWAAVANNDGTVKLTEVRPGSETPTDRV